MKICHCSAIIIIVACVDSMRNYARREWLDFFGCCRASVIDPWGALPPNNTHYNSNNNNNNKKKRTRAVSCDQWTFYWFHFNILMDIRKWEGGGDSYMRWWMIRRRRRLMVCLPFVRVRTRHRPAFFYAGSFFNIRHSLLVYYIL